MEGNVVGVCKPVGATPLEALREYVAASGGPESTRRSYAGRLDPMAEGLLVVLEGARCEEQAAWQHHGKEYAWELLLGLSSDSYDVLGLGRLQLPADWDAAVREATRALEQTLLGRRQQPYPPFSSARVAGHPLFWWAQQGRLAEVEIPRVEVEVRACRVGCVRWAPVALLMREMLERVSLVRGTGFRQEAVCTRWREVLGALPSGTRLPLLSVRCAVSSGTYVRALAHEAAAAAGCGGLAWSICRTAVLGTPLSLLAAFPVQPVSARLFRAVMALLQRRGFID